MRKRLEHILVAIEGEMDVLQIEKRIRGRVKAQMEKSQREYYLNEQMKAIQKELGEMDEGGNEITELEQKIAKAGMPKEAREKATRRAQQAEDDVADVGGGHGGAQLHRLAGQGAVEEAHQDPQGHRQGRRRCWTRTTMAWRRSRSASSSTWPCSSASRSCKGPILCLVGPPGVGKTSLGQSIARATNRKFVRMSLGGVRDEAEIRGHRRTYIGSMPGKIVQNMAKAGVHNPLFLLDEVDKMSMDFRGDPSSALLEVLDPEQNATFNDHYLEVDFDLSEVMFVCTANTLNIPAPLLDRMEVIRLPGYTEDEKMNIGRRYLVPKQMKENGLKDDELKVSDPALLDIVRHYTREAGVRNLEREIAKISRKAVKQLLLDDKEQKADRGHAAQPGQVPRRAALPLRQGRGHGPHRPGHGTGLDRGRRRAADHRGGRRAGQGQAAAHRPAGRGDAGVDPGGHDRGAQPRARCWVWSWTSTRRTTCTCTCRRARRPRTARAPVSACARRWCRR